MKRCPKCLKQFFGNAYSCPNCGHEFTEEETREMYREESRINAIQKAQSQRQEPNLLPELLGIIAGLCLAGGFVGMFVDNKYTNDMEYRMYLNLASWTSEMEAKDKIAIFLMQNKTAFLVIGLLLFVIVAFIEYARKNN